MRDNDLYNIFSKITPDSSLRERIEDRIEGKEMKKSTIKKTGRTAVLAVALVAALSASAFAMTSTGQETISGILAYFQNDKATEITSLEELAKYNEEIGKSVSKDGITLTLDNVAADDNFIHVFYTVKSDTEPFYDGYNPNAELYSDAMNISMDVQCMINGNYAGIANNNTRDGYFVDNYTYRAAEKYNIASLNIPDNFKLELFAERQNIDVNIDETETSAAFEKLYRDRYSEITDEEKAEIWYLSADIDKSKVKVESVTREIKLKLPWSIATVEKAVFSPFGNQLVVSTPAGSEAGHMMDVALTDENGTFLDILNTDLRSNGDGSSVNSYEFLKADKNTKQLKFIPVRYDEKTGDSDKIEKAVGQYPITFKISEYGGIVVTDVRFSDGVVEIDYYKDGYFSCDPAFLLLDAEGNNAEPGGKLGCILYTDVHYDTNSYTARYVYDALDDEGAPIPMGDDVKADALREKITTLGAFADPYYTLDFDNAVTVDLK